MQYIKIMKNIVHVLHAVQILLKIIFKFSQLSAAEQYIQLPNCFEWNSRTVSFSSHRRESFSFFWLFSVEKAFLEAIFVFQFYSGPPLY